MSNTFFAPGRVNLIGDHTDYNGGMVFPAALTMGTYLTVTERADERSCRFSSDNDALQMQISVDELFSKRNCWVDYPIGVLKEFADRGLRIGGFEFHFRGDLPIGAALSSSASIEMVTAVALNELNGNPLSQLELVRMAQHAENAFVGMNCGIMDQFASGFGKKNCAIALDCNTLKYDLVALEMNGLKFVIANTNKKRGLVDSAYNERRSECRHALDVLQKEVAVDALCALSREQFEEYSSLLSGNVLQRARHAVSEHARVCEAIVALRDKDMVRFGQLMNESHFSLRDDYAVTCPELDILAGEAQNFPGVLGSRMTGAGFGGCTVTLIAEGAVEDFTRKVGDSYQHLTGLRADFYVADVGDGAQMMQDL